MSMAFMGNMFYMNLSSLYEILCIFFYFPWPFILGHGPKSLPWPCHFPMGKAIFPWEKGFFPWETELQASFLSISNGFSEQFMSFYQSTY